MSTPNPAPGWYPNAHGQLQWWDGAAWGPLAAQQPAPAPQPVVQSHPQPVAPQATPEAPKPAVSVFSWLALGAAALGIVLLIVGLVLEFSGMAGVDGGPSSDGALSTAAFGEQLINTVPFLGVAAIGLGVAGTIRSRRKALGIVSMVIGMPLLGAKVLLILLMWGLYFGSGAFSQLSGGPVVG